MRSIWFRVVDAWDCFDPQAVTTSTKSSTLGVTADFLRWLKKMVLEAGMTTSQLNKLFVKPSTKEQGCALVEMLHERFVGPATTFTSHAYGYLASDTVEVMLRYEEDHPGTCFWCVRVRGGACGRPCAGAAGAVVGRCSGVVVGW